MVVSLADRINGDAPETEETAQKQTLAAVTAAEAAERKRGEEDTTRNETKKGSTQLEIHIMNTRYVKCNKFYI